MNGSDNSGDRQEANSDDEGFGIGVYGDGGLVGSVAFVIVGSPSQASAVDGAVDIVL